MNDLDDIKATFALFDDWEDRYRFLIEIGKDLPRLDDGAKIEANLVRGCQSQVWLLHEYSADSDQLHFKIDSDAHIVRGLAALVLAAADGKSPTELVALDIEALFSELQLLQHLSPTRGNGLRSMVGKIQQIAVNSQGQPT